MYLQFHSVKELSKNLDIWVRDLLVLYGVGVSSVGVLAHFTLGFGFCLLLGKTWVVVRFVLAEFGFYSFRAEFVVDIG